MFKTGFEFVPVGLEITTPMTRGSLEVLMD
jgi:hypothetical protein